jgi:hypothetical protein
MKRNLNAYWYQLGYISRDREENPVFIRYCKNPRLTREFRHLLGQLDRREIYGVFTRPFDPEIKGVHAYEIKMNH